MIYFVHQFSTPYFKIGYTADKLDQRIEKLQVGCANKLEVITVIKGSQGDEHEIQKIFNPLNVRGEWFDSSGLFFRGFQDETDYDGLSREGMSIFRALRIFLSNRERLYGRTFSATKTGFFDVAIRLTALAINSVVPFEEMTADFRLDLIDRASYAIWCKQICQQEQRSYSSLVGEWLSMTELEANKVIELAQAKMIAWLEEENSSSHLSLEEEAS